MDLWGVGIVLCELLQLPFTSGVREKSSGLLPKLWKVYLGRSDRKHAVGDRKQWPSKFKRDIGVSGLDLLERLLDFNPVTRVTAAAALAHAFFTQESFALMGYPPDAAVSPVPETPIELRKGQPGDVVDFSGKRHDWNILAGQMSPEVLLWYNNDASLQKGTPENDVIKGCFDGDAEHTPFSEIQQVDGEDMKLVITGGLRRDIGEAFFKKKLTRRCPCPKACAYVEAFKKCNRKAFLRIEASVVRPVRKMSYGKTKITQRTPFPD